MGYSDCRTGAAIGVMATGSLCLSAILSSSLYLTDTCQSAAAAACAVSPFIGVNAYYLTAYAAFGTLSNGESGTGAVDRVLDAAQVRQRA